MHHPTHKVPTSHSIWKADQTAAALLIFSLAQKEDNGDSLPSLPHSSP